MEVRFRDLKRQYEKYKESIDNAIISVASQGDFILGQEVSKFEKELAEFVGVKYAITCANGTDAMTLILMAWDVGPNDAVFVPSFTFFATAEVVSLRGATPIFVDVDKDSFNLSVDNLIQAIEYAISKKLTPKVIIPVDLFGLPADYERIEEVANNYKCLVLEDSAQGFGGTFNGHYSCSFGNAATTSFYPAKPLGCYGDGGAVFTNDDELAQLVYSLRSHGVGDHRYDNVRIGINSRLDSIQAAILSIKLKAFIEHELRDVNVIANYYNKKLESVVVIPKIPLGFTSSYAQYTIKLVSLDERNYLVNYLKNLNIPTMIYYPKPMHLQKAFEDLDLQTNSLINSEELAKHVLSIPIHPYLTLLEADFVIKSVIDGIKSFRLCEN
jgi:dTDP-4-amino-4,6-dideoxygalactose transaminase